MKSERKLLLSYLFVYPLYYVVAMGIAVLMLSAIYGWSAIFSLKIFLIFAAIMALVSYVAHWDIGTHAFKRCFRDSGAK